MKRKDFFKVFSWPLKVTKEYTSLKSGGSEFHNHGATEGNALSPFVFSLVGGIASKLWMDVTAL